MRPLDARILDALPQTQCTRCGFPDCSAYATAIASREAPINRCPPGGAEGIARLAALTGDDALPLDPDCGREEPRQRAFVDESWCIGCTLCLDTCPTDAIIGSAKRMHTVIDAHCTGCGLCLPACPVDCIVLEPASGTRTGWDAWSAAQAGHARQRYAQHQHRLRAVAPTTETAAADARTATTPDATEVALPMRPCTAEIRPVADDRATARRAAVEAALARARARQAPR